MCIFCEMQPVYLSLHTYPAPSAAGGGGAGAGAHGFGAREGQGPKAVRDMIVRDVCVCMHVCMCICLSRLSTSHPPRPRTHTQNNREEHIGGRLEGHMKATAKAFEQETGTRLGAMLG